MATKEKMKEEALDLDYAFEERAGILEYDAGYERYNAEQIAAQMYGFENKAALKKRVQELKAGVNNDEVYL